MKIDEALISKLEKLSRLSLTGAEREKAAADLERIVGMIDRLQSLDTAGVEPLVYLGRTENILREDEVKGEFSVEEAMLNAPLHGDGYFKVPKIIDI